MSSNSITTKECKENKNVQKSSDRASLAISIFSIILAIISLIYAVLSFNLTRKNSSLIIRPDIENTTISNNTMTLHFCKLQGEISKVFVVTNLNADELIYQPLESVNSGDKSFTVSFHLKENNKKDIKNDDVKQDDELLSQIETFETQSFALIIYDYLDKPQVYYGVVLPAPVLSSDSLYYQAQLYKEDQQIINERYKVDNYKNWKSSVALIDCTMLNPSTMDNLLMEKFQSSSTRSFEKQYALLDKPKTAVAHTTQKETMTINPQLCITYRGIQSEKEYEAIQKVFMEVND